MTNSSSRGTSIFNNSCSTFGLAVASSSVASTGVDDFRGRVLNAVMLRTPLLAKIWNRFSISRITQPNASGTFFASVTTGTIRCGNALKCCISTIFGSISTSRKSSAVKR